MANEVLVGLKIGAAVSGSLHAAFGSARSTVQQLGRATDMLRTQQTRMGTALATALAQGGAGVGKLRNQYDQIGRTLDQLKIKQERLNTSIARGETLKANRADLRGQAMETAGTAAVLGAPVVQSMRTAIDFQDQTRDIAITGGFDPAEEAQLSKVMRESALRWNQTQTEVARGTAVLIAGGIANAQELARYAPVLSKTATATRASMDDLGSVAIALNDNLQIGAGGLERAMNMLAYAGKRGQFELADMAKWLPQLTPQFAALGITGERAVAEIGASLQIARKGAGSNDEAANNFKNFLGKITAPDTIKDFAKAGIDLQSSMKNLVGKGMTPVQAMLQLITQYMSTKGPAAAGEFQKAMAIKDGQERETALQRLNEAYKLGELFQDMQAMSFIRPAVGNQGEMADIQKGSMAAADQGVLDADWKKRMGSPKEELKALTNSLSDAGIAVGSVLLPALVDVTHAVVPLVQQFAAWAGENPELVKGVVGLVAGLLAGKLAFIGVAYGANLVMSPFVAMTTTITGMSAKWTLLRAMWQAGKFAPLITGLTRVGGGLLTVLKYSGLFLRGFGMAFGAPLMLAGRGVLLLGKVLGGSLLTGLRLAGQAVLWLGRALLMNPIGLLITGIAVSAYLIYRYWEPIKGFFSGLWTEIKAGFNGGLTGILGLLVNFSPLGLFYRAFSGVMNYFGIELPSRLSDAGGQLMRSLMGGLRSGAQALLGPLWSEIQSGFSGGLAGIAGLILNFSPLGLFYRAFSGVMNYFGIELPGKFTEFGGMLVTGLVNGIRNAAGAAKDAVLDIGSSIKSGFTSTLGINSPSRVFMGYGANLSEGAAIGITGQQGLVRKAALGMAAATAVTLSTPSFGVPSLPDLLMPSPQPRLAVAAQPLIEPAVIPARPLQRPPVQAPASGGSADIAQRLAGLARTAAPATHAGGMGGNITVHFNPSITVPGGDANAKEAVTQALKLSQQELEQMLRRILADQQRRAF